MVPGPKAGKRTPQEKGCVSLLFRKHSVRLVLQWHIAAMYIAAMSALFATCRTPSLRIPRALVAAMLAMLVVHAAHHLDKQTDMQDCKRTFCRLL